MVDVSEKPVTTRIATASAGMTIRAEVLDQLFAGKLPKGDAIAVAKLAGISAAKATGQLIPLCHPLILDDIQIRIDRQGKGRVGIVASVKTTSRTGAEMEAMTAVSVAALALYDMAKAADRSMTIGSIQLEEKSGGRSGHFKRAGAPEAEQGGV